MKDSNFRVVIVGGGIGGLALALSLQHAGIDFVLIEKGKELDPQVGAAIGILPNGARILDQLGCFDDLLQLTVSMESTATHAADGSLIGEVSDTLKLIERRTGYPVLFIDRQLLLRTLAKHVAEPHRILLDTAVEATDEYEDRVVVRCVDGRTIDADIVIGADGVHSAIRREMWRHADLVGQGEKFSKDKEVITAEYKCLFGISTGIAGMEPGTTDRTYASGVSTLSYVGKEGRVFWFVFIKMGKVYHGSDIPRFTEADASTAVQEIGSLPIKEASRVTISDLYETRACCSLVAIEEADFQHWSYGRLACLGDAIHKMTPNLGAGASCAMESAAVLSNTIVHLASLWPKPSPSVIRTGFERYQDERETRVKKAMGLTNKLTRVQALETMMDFVFTHYVGPKLDDYYAEVFSSFVIGAPVVDHLPIPARSLQGTMPFNPRQGWGFEESARARAKRASPLIAVALLSLLWTPKFLGLLQNISGVKLFDYSFAHFGSQIQDLTRQDLAFAGQSHVAYGLWLLEATRLNNVATLAQFPIVFGTLAYYLGPEVSASLFFFFSYVQSPIEKFRASDARLTDVSYVYCVGPLVLLSTIASSWLYWHPAAGDDTIWRQVMHVHPILLPVVQFMIARYLRRSTIRSDRLQDVRRDMSAIRRTTGLLAITSSTCWWFSQLDLNHDATASAATSHLAASAPSVALMGCVSLTLGAIIWLALAFQDLRHAGMVQMNWIKVATLAAVVLLCLGPGAMLAAGWQWREEILLRRRHRDAVVKQRDSQKG